MPRKVRRSGWTVPGQWGSGGLGWGGAAAYLSQEGGAHSKQLMHWRVKAPQLALMMQSGREEEGPEVLAESATTYTQGTRSLPPPQWPLQTHQCTHSTDSPDHASPWVTNALLHKLLACIWFAILSSLRGPRGKELDPGPQGQGK